MKLKHVLASAVALLCSVGVWSQPTASTPVVGNTYYLYNPTTKLFMTTNVDLPFVRPTGSAWTIGNAAGHDGWITLRLKDASEDGVGYFWGKWWANNPNQNSSSYSDETVYQLVNASGSNYKLKSYAWGATESYIYINTGNEGDRSFRLACNSHEQAGMDEGYTIWQFISEEDYADYMTNDYTSSINNNDFLSGTTGWTLEGEGNKQAHGNTAIEYWNAAAASGSFDYYQSISLPAGKYVLRAAMYNSTNGESGASFDTTGQCGVYGTSNGVTKNANVTVDGTAYNIYTTDELLVPDGNLRLGFKNSTTMTARWFGADWIQLTCTEYCLSAVATELPANGAMAADTWYYYALPTSDEYEFTSSNAATLTYSQDGTQLISVATGTDETFTATQTKTLDLAAGRVYVKTNAATTLTVSYKYNVGSATANVAYVQGGENVTIAWADASSNNPGATFAKNGTPTITFNGNSVEIATTATGFTFTVPGGLTANTAYTLSIPADAFGYSAGSTYNAAQNITLTTPALFDGNYYFRVASTYNGSSTGTSAAVGKYLSRGGSYGTHTTVDSYGQAINVTTDGNNVTTLKLMDSQAFIYHAGSWESWADAGSTGDNTAHTVILTDGVYRISSNQNSGKYFKYNDAAVNNELIPVFDDGTGANNGPIINWAVETISEHATAMQAKKDNQAATAAAAAYASGNYNSLNGITTVSALESELTSSYIEGAFVSPSEINSVQESYQPRAGNGATEPKEVYSNTINITEAGFYKFSMQAFFRSSTNANVQAVHTAGADMPGAVLFFGDSETQIKSIYDEAGSASSEVNLTGDDAWKNDILYNGTYYPNSTNGALVKFQADKYHNDVWFYCSTPGEYTYGVKVMGYAGSQWFIYSPESVTITSYAPAATAADYTALNNAINAARGITLGFDEDEYATYNVPNIASYIATAEAIDQEATNSQLIVRTAAANLALPAANAAEVNAVYNGDFALSTNDGALTGWTRDNGTVLNGGQYQPRPFVLTDGQTNYANIAPVSPATSTHTAAYLRWDDKTAQNTVYYYGATTGYTMPLKAATYRFTAKVGAWGDGAGKSLKIALLNSSDSEVASQTLELPANALSTADVTDIVEFNFVATIESAGNYKLAISNASGDVNNAIVISQIVLKKAVATPVTIAETDAVAPAVEPLANVTLTRTLVGGQWNGFSVPFGFTIAGSALDGASVKQFASATDNEVTLEDATEIVAGKPYLVKPASNVENPTFNGVAVTNPAETVEGTGDYKFAAHLYNTALATDGSIAYVSTTDSSIKKLTSGSIKGLRSVFQIPTGAGVKALVVRFGDDTDAIATVDAEGNIVEGPIYNLAGQRVNKIQKGIYIQNGKKVLVK